jgi:cytolysin (calcineurin-like family phosphatase)
MPVRPTRRHLLTGAAGLGLALTLPRLPLFAQTQRPATDATFLFSCDVHACLVSADGLSPGCADEGKTDAALLRHVAAVNAIGGLAWPATIDGKPSGLESAGTTIATPLGLGEGAGRGTPAPAVLQPLPAGHRTGSRALSGL